MRIIGTITTNDKLEDESGAEVYYRIFVKNYGIISKPQTELLKKDGFHWNEEGAAFERLKLAMSTTLVLLLPDFFKAIRAGN